jgi:hypothetical protein
VTPWWANGRGRMIAGLNLCRVLPGLIAPLSASVQANEGRDRAQTALKAPFAGRPNGLRSRERPSHGRASGWLDSCVGRSRRSAVDRTPYRRGAVEPALELSERDQDPATAAHNAELLDDVLVEVIAVQRPFPAGGELLAKSLATSPWQSGHRGIASERSTGGDRFGLPARVARRGACRVRPERSSDSPTRAAKPPRRSG